MNICTLQKTGYCSEF